MSRLGAIIKKVHGDEVKPASDEVVEAVDRKLSRRTNGNRNRNGNGNWKQTIQDVLANRRVRHIALVTVLGLVVLFFLAESVFQYNLLTSWEVVTDARRADFHRELQRRENLIPNIVRAAKQYAMHEQAMFQYVCNARDMFEALRAFSAAKGGGAGGGDMSKTLAGLIALAEQYPDLKATQTVQDLIREAADTENRIAAAKQEYNKAAETYNQYRTVFPGNIFAMLYGFRAMDYIGTEEALNVPKIGMNVPAAAAGKLAAAVQLPNTGVPDEK
ncbi:LemA family protein [Verrucomicrobiota bacterium]